MQTPPAPFYSRAPLYFGLALLTAFVGFYPSFFSRLRETDATHHLHGLTATAWMLLLIVQSYLFRQRKLALHRQIGKLSLVIVPLFLFSGVLVVHHMLSVDNGFYQQFGSRLAFLDVVSVVYFAAAFGLALYYRKNLQLHARFMASTAILVLPPALARAIGNYVPGISSFEQSVHASYGISELIIIYLLIDEYRNGKVRTPYMLLLATMVLQHIGFDFVHQIGWWTQFCQWIGAL